MTLLALVGLMSFGRTSPEWWMPNGRSGVISSTLQSTRRRIVQISSSLGTPVLERSCRAISHRLMDRLRAVVFVDAIVPPAAGEHRTSDQFLRFLDDKTVDGRLLQWLDWWPPEVVSELVRSPQQLELRSDMPRLHRSFYDAPIPMPEDWSSGPCAYLQLSPAYDEESRTANELGWPRAVIDGSHLSMFTDPSAVLATVENLVDKVDSTTSTDLA